MHSSDDMQHNTVSATVSITTLPCNQFQDIDAQTTRQKHGADCQTHFEPTQFRIRHDCGRRGDHFRSEFSVVVDRSSTDVMGWRGAKPVSKCHDEKCRVYVTREGRFANKLALALRERRLLLEPSDRAITQMRHRIGVLFNSHLVTQTVLLTCCNGV